MIKQFNKALSGVVPDLKSMLLVERFETQDYFCPNITNVPMRQCDKDTNICVITGEKTWGTDALREVVSSTIRTLLNLEGKEVPVIKLNSLNDINPEVAEQLK